LLPYPLYSPDLAPSDFHLFRSLQNSLRGKTFDSDEAVNRHLVQFFADKDRSFYEQGIMKLERWQKVIEQNGHISWIDLCSLYKLINFEKHKKMRHDFSNNLTESMISIISSESSESLERESVFLGYIILELKSLIIS